MSTTGLDLSSLLAQLQLNDEQKQLKAVPRYSFDGHTPQSFSSQYLQTTDLFHDRRIPLSSTLSLPESLTPAAALLANFDSFYADQQFSDDDDAVCRSLDAGRATKATDRRTASLGDALAPLGLSRQNSQQQQQSATRYKTELCRPFEEHGTCRYGNKCQFAHGRAELRVVSRHPKYKTDLCRTFHSTGLCPYGRRCHFVHNEEERGTEILPYDHHQTPDVAAAQNQLLQRRLSGAVAADNADVAGCRRAMQHQFSQQQSVFESDGDELTAAGRGPAMPPTQWGVLPPTTGAAQHQLLTRRISVADPLHHIQQLQQQTTTRTNRLQSLGLISPPGFESIPAAYSSLPLAGFGAPASRSIGSAAESISSTASSVDGGSRSTSPTLGLCALPETQIWQQQAGWTMPTVNTAAPPAAPVPAVQVSPAADPLQEVWARLLAQLPAEKIVEMILATMKQQQPSPAVSSPELSPPTSAGSPWPQLPNFPTLSSTAASNAAVW